MRLTASMAGKAIVDPSLSMSLLVDHPNVSFNYYRQHLKTAETEMLIESELRCNVDRKPAHKRIHLLLLQTSTISF